MRYQQIHMGLLQSSPRPKQLGKKGPSCSNFSSGSEDNGLIPNAVTHYQTCFKAYRENDAFKPLSTIRNIVYRWLLEKEKDPLCRDAKKDFFKKCNWDNLDATHSSVGTNTVYTDNFTSWAMRYTHHDSELGPGRYWHVDIGIKEEDAVATFYCRVSYAHSRYDLSIEHPIPPTNTPRFIRDIVAEKSGLKIIAEKKSSGFLISRSRSKSATECI